MRLRPLIIAICCAIAIVVTAYFGEKLRKDTNPTECVKQHRINKCEPPVTAPRFN